jgi:hypothetical protein
VHTENAEPRAEEKPEMVEPCPTLTTNPSVDMVEEPIDTKADQPMEDVEPKVEDEEEEDEDKGLDLMEELKQSIEEISK